MPQPPMPGPGAAPNEGPAEQGQDAAEQGGDANSPTKLIVGVDAGLSKVSQLLEATQVDQDVKDGVAQALEMYRAAIKQLMDQGPPGGDQAPQGGPQAPAKGPMPMKNGVMGEHGNAKSVPM